MNLGLVLSYIVAGVITMALLTMNVSMQRSTAEITIQNMKKNHMNAIAETMEFDIAKVGYMQNSVRANPIIVADSNRFVFDTDVDDNGVVDRISWHFTNNQVTSTANPNDFMLRRTQVNDIDNVTGGLLSLLGLVNKTEVTDIPFGVIDVNFRYYSNTGSGTPLPMPVTGGALNNIEQIEVEITLESDQEVSTFLNSRRVRTHYTKLFSPVNLNN